MANENLSEKVSVNINSSTLSSIDLLVDNGYYSNRSDFINHALRTTLQQHQSTLDRVIEQNKSTDRSHHWFIGLCNLSADEINGFYEKGTEIRITGYGVLGIDEDVDEEKLFSIVKNINIKGKLVCSESIKEHYGIKK